MTKLSQIIDTDAVYRAAVKQLEVAQHLAPRTAYAGGPSVDRAGLARAFDAENRRRAEACGYVAPAASAPATGPCMAAYELGLGSYPESFREALYRAGLGR